MEGWIKIFRSLAEHQIWLSETFTDGQAWVDLLLLANHKPNTINVRGVRLEIPVGCLARSEESLAQRWKWSRGKVRRFLNFLEQENMIKTVQQKGRVINCISVVNWNAYQKNGTTDGTTDRTTNGQQTVQQTVQEQEEKNVKNVKKKEIGELFSLSKPTHKKIQKQFTPPLLDEVSEYFAQSGLGGQASTEAQRFINHYSSNGWKVGKNSMKDWQAAVRGWIQRNKEWNQEKNQDNKTQVNTSSKYGNTTNWDRTKVYNYD